MTFNLTIWYALIPLPIILGYFTSAICHDMSYSPDYKDYKPPKELFMIIWPILYILIGIAWYFSRTSIISNILFIILNILLCSWIVIYGCYKSIHLAFYILLLSLLLSILCYTSSTDINAKYCMVPLIVWLSFATLLSFGQLKN